MVAATVFHSLSMTSPDNPAYENNPGDWNRSHRASVMLQPGDFANSNGVTFGVDSNGVVTASALGGGGSTSIFANSNGVSWGTAGSTVTATVRTDYQSAGAYLTTAALSQDSSKYAGINFAGTNISGTLNTSGLSLSVGAGAVATSLSFANSNGVSWGINASTITATVKTDYQTSGAYLTTAALSQDSSKYAGTSTGATNASVTLNTAGIAISVAAPAAGTSLSFANSNGVSFGIAGSTLTATVATNYQSSGAYLTTAALSQDSSKYAGINGAITGGSITMNTSGVSINLPAYLTTAALSQDSSKYAGTAGAITGGSITMNTSGVSINLPAYLTTAQSPGAYLTTAALSQDSSKYAGTGTSATNASITLNTAGLAISVGAPGGGATISSYENMPFVNASSVSVSNSTSYAAAFQLPQAGSFSFLRIPVVLNIVANNTIATSAASANASFQGGTTWNAVAYSVGSGASSRSLMSVASGSMGWGYTGSVSVAANGTQYSISQSLNFGAEGTTSQSSTQYSASTSNYNISSNPFSIIVPGSSVWADIPFANSLSAGPYWLVYGVSTSSATNSAAFSGLSKGPGNYNFNLFVSQPGLGMFVMGSTNKTSGGMYGMGAFSTAGGGTTANLPMSALSSTTNFPRVYFQLLRSA